MISVIQLGLVARKPDFVACKQIGADQPVHRLISAFGILLLVSMMAKLTTHIIIFQLVSVTEQIWLNIT